MYRNIKTFGRITAAALSISAIHYFSYKVQADANIHRLYSWGWNNFGQLGLGHSNNQYIPQLVTALSAHSIVSVSSKASISAAVTADGKVYTWGKSKGGVLGHQVIGENNLNIPTEIESINDLFITQVACGNNHMAVITKEGDLYTWGNPEHGKLGHSYIPLEQRVTKTRYDTKTAFNKASTPQKVNIGKKVKQVVCANQHTLCLSEDGEVFVFGLNKKGFLGLDKSIVETQDPTKLQLPEKILKVDVGADYSVALSENGKLYAWGSNYFGQLGAASPSFFEKPKLITGFDVPIKDFSCGEQFVGAIDGRGRLFTWGYGQDGQLGHPNRQDISTPSLVEIEFPVKALSCGIGHVGLISTDNKLYMFGRGKEGQLGRGGEIESSNSYRVIPQLVELLKNKKVLSVSCGGSHTLAIID